MDHKDFNKKVFELMSKTRPVDDDKRWTVRIALVAVVVFVLAGSAFTAYSFFMAPQGVITSPARGTLTSRVIDIQGYTKNIPPDRRYVWLMVDIKKIGLCWPKCQIYKPGETFKVKIYEGGPNKEFVVGLYAVNQNYQNDILKWIEDVKRSGIADGIPMMPETFKLDDVRIRLQGTGIGN